VSFVCFAFIPSSSVLPYCRARVWQILFSSTGASDFLFWKYCLMGSRNCPKSPKTRCHDSTPFTPPIFFLVYPHSNPKNFPSNGFLASWGPVQEWRNRRWSNTRVVKCKRMFRKKKMCSIPLGQKSFEMAHEPRGVCFKLWVKKSCSCFLHSPRSHVGDVL